ncbi:glycosyltransferase family 2 protein [Pseudooceanicola aestuarii]|uniref:glycosyltransferase family 2 protein n=1 Tax=Pseudooceanicola aestuarii TaxID=2697319 RepID=UPI0013D19219|nr:glycosyltransferase family 2 protein [Pseudooceanicola aestuarii]
MTERPPTQRPLVTFALFAYNQEDYIREAIEGAFSQTYEPLEIILSDDCSTDRTFEIMQEMAAAYEGPHRVISRKNSSNIGTVDHLIAVSREASGGLLIVAAGDDISKPERSAVLTAAWIASGAMALYSGHILIDDTGKPLSTTEIIPPHAPTQKLFSGVSSPMRHNGVVRHVPGYSAAYDTEFFRNVPMSKNKSLNEDALATCLLNLNSFLIEQVASAEVFYRTSRTSASSHQVNTDARDILEAERRRVRFASSCVKFYPYLLELIDSSSASTEDLARVRKRLKRRLKNYKIILITGRDGLLGRIGAARHVHGIKSCMTWVVRLAGPVFFSRAKSGALRLKLGQK